MSWDHIHPAINAALNGMRYTPAADYNGPAQLDISVNDMGNTGSGGPQTASASIAITVQAVNDPPVIPAPPANVMVCTEF